MVLSVAGNFVYWLECGENKKWGVHFSLHIFVTLFRPGHHFPKIIRPIQPTGKLHYRILCTYTHITGISQRLRRRKKTVPLHYFNELYLDFVDVIIFRR
jgi:hypothetical protein